MNQNKKLKNVIVGFGRFIAFPKLAQGLSSVIALFHTGGYSRSFAKIGINPSIKHPDIMYGLKNISVGDNFKAGKNLILQAWGEKSRLDIGSNVSLSPNCQISCSNNIVIGDGCLFGNNVFVTDNFHGATNTLADIKFPPLQRPIISKGSIQIGKNVWLGRNVCVMPGVTIGENAVIGANAVVTKDIPANCIAAGVPAKVIKTIKNENDISS